MKTNVRNYTSTELLNKAKSLKSFKAIPDGYWFLGVRSNEDAPNVFDDKGYLFRNEQFIKVFPMTTNAGTPYLQGGFLKYNKVGTAHVKANEWYYDLWKYGLHRGKMPALVQVGNILIFRDGDMDNKAEEIGKFIDCNGQPCYNGTQIFPMPMDMIQGIVSGIAGGELRLLAGSISDTELDRGSNGSGQTAAPRETKE